MERNRSNKNPFRFAEEEEVEEIEKYEVGLLLSILQLGPTKKKKM